jgi:hypothetical protein
MPYGVLEASQGFGAIAEQFLEETEALFCKRELREGGAIVGMVGVDFGGVGASFLEEIERVPPR